MSDYGSIDNPVLKAFEPEELDLVKPAPVATPLTTRWRPVMVQKILDTQVVNLELMEESHDVKLAGVFFRKVRNARGMLKRADVRITFELAEAVHPNALSAHISNGCSMSSVKTTVSVGTTQAKDDISGQRVFSIVVPVVDGLFDSMPLLDQLHSKGEHIIHQCIRLPGINEERKGVTYRIRLKVNDEYGTVRITSTSVDLFNTARISEAYGNLSDNLCMAKDKVVGCFTGCGRKLSRKTEPKSDGIPDEEATLSGEKKVAYGDFIPVAGVQLQPNGDQSMQPIPIYMPSSYASQQGFVKLDPTSAESPTKQII